jgi:hypothetical protein
MSSYPVIEQHVLGPVSRSFLRSARREIADLPSQPPGTELVALLNGRYERLPSPLRGNERAIVDASEVLVINMNPEHLIEVAIELTSNTPGESFMVRVKFSCTVVDPLEVASRAPRDIAPTLENHIMNDSKLMSIGNDFGVDDVAKLREIVAARIQAWCMGKRPPVTGVNVVLANVKVDTPEDLRKHVADKREEERRQALERLRENFTFEQARLIEEVIERGPEAFQALALKLNEERYEAASGRAFSDRDRQREYLIKLIRVFADGGHLDGVAFDTPRLVDELVNSLGGVVRNKEVGHAAGDSLALGPDGQSRRNNGPSELKSLGDDGGVDRPDDPPDEETLSG